jgi:aspartate-semialdehyde dehydrogenase
MVAANINFDDLNAHNGIIACPGSAAIQLLAVLSHLHKAATVKRVVVTSLQAVSGSGQEGIDELEHQVRQLFNMQSPEAHFFPHQIAFSCLPHIGEFTGTDATGEEISLAADVQRLLGTDIQITATCVLVPVFYGHSQSVTITTDKSITASEARVLLMQDSSIQVVDNPRASLYPLASDVSGEDEVFVGRIREAAGFDNTLNLWIAADNIRRGAALNAVLIAEDLLQRDLVSVSATGIFQLQ